jgi:hypothetical protein
MIEAAKAKTNTKGSGGEAKPAPGSTKAGEAKPEEKKP